MDQLLSRRSLLAASCTLPLLALPGCASIPGLGMVDALRRLLPISSQRAFARLLNENGFFEDELARVPLPQGGAIAGALPRTPMGQNQLPRPTNPAAANAAPG